MWRVLVVSDSHGRDENVYKAMDQTGGFDAFIHLGDVGTNYREMMNRAGVSSYIVRGNCDSDYALKTDVRPYFGPHKIYASHGHLQGAASGLGVLRYTALSAGCNIAMYGHTHMPLILAPEHESPLTLRATTKPVGDTALSYEGRIAENDVIILNPGSVSLPRQDGGKRSFAVLELEEDGGIKVFIKYLA